MHRVADEVTVVGYDRSMISQVASPPWYYEELWSLLHGEWAQDYRTRPDSEIFDEPDAPSTPTSYP